MSVRPHRDKAGIIKDAKVTGHPRLMNPDLGDDVVDLPFSVGESPDNAPPSDIGKNLENIFMHICAYAL